MVDSISSKGSAHDRIFAVVTTLAGLVLAGYAAAIHLSVAGRAQCDGCAPFHPLFVVAPFVGGVALLLVGGYLVSR
ncbi:hypothetical protein [Haladaptatus sp. NG-SE-30]